MAKVVVAKLAAETKQLAKRKTTSVTEKRVRGGDGKLVTFRTIDTGGATLTEDLTKVFKANVARARRENKELFGNADRVPNG